MIDTKIIIELQNTNERVELDLTQDISIPLTYQLFDIYNPALNYLSGSLTVKLPGTQKNNKYFNHIYEINGNINFNPKAKTKVWVYQKGVEVFSGYLFLLKINRLNKKSLQFKEIEYEVNLISSTINIFNSNDTLSILDFEKFNHTFNIDAVYNSWFGKIKKNGVDYTNIDRSLLRNTFISISDEDGFVRLDLTTVRSSNLKVGDYILVNCNINYISGHQKIKAVGSDYIVLEYQTKQLVGGMSGTGYIYNVEFTGDGYVYAMYDLALGVNKKNHENYTYINDTGSLIEGHNYIIKLHQSGDDFTTSGSPNNTDGQMFIYNGVPPTWNNGSTLCETSIDDWRVNEFRPAIYVKGIIDDIFNHYNIKYNSNFLNSQMFKRIVIPYSFGNSFASFDLSALQFTSTISSATYNHNLYPFNSNYSKNINTPIKYRYYSKDQDFTEPLGGAFGYTQQSVYEPSGTVGWNAGGNFFIQGCEYKIVSIPGGNNLSGPMLGYYNANAPGGVNNTFIAKYSSAGGAFAGDGSVWNTAKVQMRTPVASHHVIPFNAPYDDTNRTTKRNVNSILISHWTDDTNLSGGVYTMPNNWGETSMTFYFSGELTYQIGDLPDDFGGSSISTPYDSSHYNAVNGTMIPYSIDQSGTTFSLPYANSPQQQDKRLKYPVNWIEFQKSIDGGSTWTVEKAFFADNSTNPIYSNSIWTNTIVQGQAKIKLYPGDKVRVIIKSSAKVIALRTDGKPCVGTSGGGANGAVQMEIKVNNAKFWNAVDQINIDEDLNVEYDFTSIVPKITISDFLKSFIRRFNLLVQWNPITQVFDIEPKKDYFTDDIIDWSDKVNYNENIEITTISDNAYKTYLFADKDNSDYSNTQHKEITNRTYGSKYLEVENDYTNDTYTIDTIFAPPINVGPGLNYAYSDKVIMTSYNYSNYEFNPAATLTLGFYSLRGSEYAFNLYSSQSFGLTNIKLTDGDSLASIYPTITSNDNHIYPTIDLNFSNPIKEFYDMPTHNNWIFNLFYESDMKNITEPESKLVKFNLLLKPTDIQSLSFKPKYLLEGYLFRLNKIKNYEPNSTGLTDVEFIGIV